MRIRRAAAQASRLSLEPLEDRCLPSSAGIDAGWALNPRAPMAIRNLATALLDVRHDAPELMQGMLQQMAHERNDAGTPPTEQAAFLSRDTAYQRNDLGSRDSGAAMS